MSYFNPEETVEDALYFRIDQAETALDIAVAQQDLEQVNICCGIIAEATCELVMLRDLYH